MNNICAGGVKLTGLILIRIRLLSIYATISLFLLETPSTLTAPCGGCLPKTHSNVLKSYYQRESAVKKPYSALLNPLKPI
jgi:hypothetical protein